MSKAKAITVLLVVISCLAAAGCGTEAADPDKIAILMGLHQTETVRPDDIRDMSGRLHAKWWMDQAMPPLKFEKAAGRRRGKYLDWTKDVPVEPSANQMTPISIGIVVEDKRPADTTGDAGLAMVPLVPYATERRNGLSAGLPSTDNKRLIADFRDVVPLLIARALRTSRTVSHARYETEAGDLSQYESVLKITLNKYSESNTVISYGLSLAALIPVLVGLPTSRLGYEADVEWELVLNASGEKLCGGNFQFDKGFYFNGYEVTIRKEKQKASRVGMAGGLCQQIVAGTQAALAERTRAQWYEIVSKHEAWRIGRGEYLAYKNPETAPKPTRITRPKPVRVATSTGSNGQTPAAPFRNAYAVVIGIAKYENAGKSGLRNLAYADDDAKAFREALIARGWNDSRVKMLTNEKATERNIRITLESWLTKAGRDDMILLYWSGHGFPDPEDPDKVYFACYDTDMSIPATGFRMDRVRDILNERNARNVVVLADTCHAGKIITRAGKKGVSVGAYVEKLKRDKSVPKGWVFMVSAESDRNAIEHKSWSNGAFTHCLLKALGGDADGYQSAGAKDGAITMGELRTYLTLEMPSQTQQVLGVAKHPLITTSTGDPAIWKLSLGAMQQ